MNKNLIYFFLFLMILLTTNVFPSNSSVDSLKLELKNNNIADTAKINVLLGLYENLIATDSTSATEYAHEALQLAIDLKSDYYLGKIYHRMGFKNYQKSRFKEAELYYKKALEYRREAADSVGIATSLRMIGVISSIRGDFDKALPNIHEALEIYRAIGDSIGISNTLNDLGVYYDKQNDTEKALEYYERAIEMRKLAGQGHTVAQLLNNVAIIHSRNENFKEALDYYKEAIEFASKNNETHLLSALYVNIGRAYSIMEKYGQAGNYYMLALELKNEIGDKWGKAYLYNSMGRNYFNQNYFDKALDHYKMSLEICHELDLIDLTKDNYEDISALYSEIGNYKEAYNYYKEYVNALKLFMDEEKQSRISEMQSKIEDERKANKIALLTSEKEFQEKQLRKNRILIISLFAAILMVIILGLYTLAAYREKVRVYKFAETLNNELEERVSKEVEENRKKDIMLAQQNKQVIMGEMISNIAHQWRQPLNTLGIIIQNIEEAYNFGEVNEKYLKEKVIKSMSLIEYMAQTIDDFRYFFKPEKTKELFDVKVAIKRTLTFTEETLKKQGVKIILNLEDDVFANGYSNEYSQVIMNLLNNSKDVLVERQIPDPWVKITLSKKNKQSVVSVEDNGGGISELNPERIFEPYYTTKDATGGTGLGLYMSKIIIEKNMDGILSVTNSDSGAKFFVLL